MDDSVGDSLLMKVVKRGIQAVIAVLVALALASGYRAYFQVHSLELRTGTETLRAGEKLGTRVVSYARTHVDVVVEIIQDGHRETVATQLVRSNAYAALDPRPQHASQSIVLTPEMRSRFHAGPAVVRATATGRPQWLRLPPPVVRERKVIVG